jgi:hypothetical protein
MNRRDAAMALGNSQQHLAYFSTVSFANMPDW